MVIEDRKYWVLKEAKFLSLSDKYMSESKKAERRRSVDGLKVIFPNDSTPEGLSDSDYITRSEAVSLMSSGDWSYSDPTME